MSTFVDTCLQVHVDAGIRRVVQSVPMPATVVDEVRTRSTFNPIGTVESAENPIVARAAAYPIVAFAANDDVIARAAS